LVIVYCFIDGVATQMIMQSTRLKTLCLFLCLLLSPIRYTHAHSTGRPDAAPLLVKKCNDFELTGQGIDPAWNAATWNPLTMLDSSENAYETKFKILYSSSGLYVLFQGADKKITTKLYKDFDSIFNGDVFEVFFHPDPGTGVYYEYEVNHLGKELILTISTVGENGYQSWVPRRSNVKKIVNIVGGEKEIDSSIRSWTAEIFFPYSALGLLPRVPPASGSIWNANFCRLDYDSGKMIKWSWSAAIKTSFHELDAFKTIKFE